MLHTPSSAAGNMVSLRRERGSCRRSPTAAAAAAAAALRRWKADRLWVVHFLKAFQSSNLPVGV
jgi:hypothetical protein